MMADTQDLFLERLAGGTHGSYEVDGTERTFDTRTEEIAVRGDFPEKLHPQYAPVKILVRSTVHGPVISDQYKAFENPVSMRWTALDKDDTSYEAFFRLNFAADWGGFVQALHFLVAPTLNIIFADRQGNIGYLGAGRIPVRRYGDGTLPGIGWFSERGWSGYIPAASWPQAYNPTSGLIVTANNKVAGDDYPYFISREWASSARATRIQDLLKDKINAKGYLTVEDMAEIQGDTVDLDAQRLMLQLSSFVPESEEQVSVWAQMKTWRGDMAGKDPRAAIFSIWMDKFRKRLFSAKLRSTIGNAVQLENAQRMIETVRLSSLTEILSKQGEGWCTDRTGILPCQAQLAASLQEALDELSKLTGTTTFKEWRWEKLNTTLYAHSPFSSIKPLDQLAVLGMHVLGHRPGHRLGGRRSDVRAPVDQARRGVRGARRACAPPSC